MLKTCEPSVIIGLFSIVTTITSAAFDCSTCNPHGLIESCNSSSTSCVCSPGYSGANCYQCNKGFYQTSNTTCTPCGCNVHAGDVKNMSCDPLTGQCAPCKPHVTGRRCSECEPGFLANRSSSGELFSCGCQKGFKYNKTSRQCEEDHHCFCYNHSDKCDSLTKACLNCTSNTMGRRCDKCKNKYYGDARTGRPDACQPCPSCNSSFSTGNCYLNSRHVMCECVAGHYGKDCQFCQTGWYHTPPEAACEKCACNGNLDLNKSKSCDPETGQCLHCMPNTTGLHCEVCSDGYRGDAIKGKCDKIATESDTPDSSGNLIKKIILGVTIPLAVGLILFVGVLIYNNNCKINQHKRLPFWTVELSGSNNIMDIALLDPVTNSPYNPVLSEIEDQVDDALDKLGYIDDDQL